MIHKSSHFRKFQQNSSSTNFNLDDWEIALTI